MNLKYNSNMQQPGLASVSNFAGNMKAGFMTGFTGSTTYKDKNGQIHNRYSPFNGGLRGTIFNVSQSTDENGNTQKYWNPQMSVGGALSAGYGLGGGAIAGAASGAVLSNFLEGGNAVRGAATGALIGGAALIAAPIALGATAKGTLKLFQNSGNILAGIGSASANIAKGIGHIATGFATTAVGAMEKGGLASMLNPVSRSVGTFTNVASKFIKHKPGNNENGIISDYSLSGLGKAVVFGGALIKGAKDAAKTYMNDKRGQIDPYISSVTPQIRLMDDAGASGDLVFALNNNRRG